MLEVVILFCLAADPSRCEEHVTTLAEETQTTGCFVIAQQLGADWLSRHPGLTMRSWTCQDVLFHKQHIHNGGQHGQTAT